MPNPTYPQITITPFLGLSLVGMDEVIALDMLLIDTFASTAGGTVKVNGAVVTSPNFNDTTPAAPGGGTNVLWQKDGSGNISAYVTIPSSSWSSLTGTLNNGQVIPYADAGISRLGAASLALGNGTNGDSSGSLTLTGLQLGPTFVTGAYNSFSNANALVLRGDVLTAAILEIHNQYESGIDLYGHGSNGGRGPAIYFLRSRPTEQSPTAIQNGDMIGTFLLSGYDGADYFSFCGQQEWVADGDWTTTVRGTALQFFLVGGQPNTGDAFRMLLLANDSATGGREGLYLTPSSGSTSSLHLMSGGSLNWLSSVAINPNTAIALPDTSISRLGAASLAIGNGTAGDFSGTLKTTIVNAVTGFQINGAATSGNVLRGNGTNFVSAQLSFADLTGSAPAAGSDTQVQFNSSNVLAGNANFTWDNTNKQLLLTGSSSSTPALKLTMPNNTPNGALVINNTTFGNTDAKGSVFFQNNSGTFGIVNNNVSALLVDSTGLVTFPQITAVTGPSVVRMGNTKYPLRLDTGTDGSKISFNNTSAPFYMAMGVRSNSTTGFITFGSAANLSADLVEKLAIDSTGILATYKSIATVSGGVPAIYGSVSATAQSASIGATTLYAVPAGGAGVYRITYYMKITTAGSTSGSVTLTLSWTDVDDSAALSVVIPTPANATDITGVVSGELVVDAKLSTNIQYATTYASAGGTAMVYKLKIKAEAL